jgi:hypothetical protein
LVGVGNERAVVVAVWDAVVVGVGAIGVRSLLLFGSVAEPVTVRVAEGTVGGVGIILVRDAVAICVRRSRLQHVWNAVAIGVSSRFAGAEFGTVRLAVTIRVRVVRVRAKSNLEFVREPVTVGINTRPGTRKQHQQDRQ